MSDAIEVAKVLDEYEKGWSDFKVLFNDYKSGAIKEKMFLISVSMLLLNVNHLKVEVEKDDVALDEKTASEINNILNDGAL